MKMASIKADKRVYNSVRIFICVRACVSMMIIYIYAKESKYEETVYIQLGLTANVLLLHGVCATISFKYDLEVAAQEGVKSGDA